MAWTIEFDEDAERDFADLDRSVQRRIARFLLDRVAPDPRRFGEPLAGDWSGHWRYRVGDFRIIARLETDRLIVLVIRIGHRRQVYR